MQLVKFSLVLTNWMDCIYSYLRSLREETILRTKEPDGCCWIKSKHWTKSRKRMGNYQFKAECESAGLLAVYKENLTFFSQTAENN